ncbi:MULTISPECIES: M15 family metallopeptidase [unclassified Enterococcus]|uniref:M15 family metallopeptidase n=1 Tax=unclassified Enterococcus TaxID=2608891 RepID=UPI000BBD19DB|nr:MULTISPECIES: M15 family metallopeptidase [unclassified Enterococcus]ATF73838.1 D-alanyl-D-alanine carboxypeptidase [Enterococcus sp. FDAARGOS_375]
MAAAAGFLFLVLLTIQVNRVTAVTPTKSASIARSTDQATTSETTETNEKEPNGNTQESQDQASASDEVNEEDFPTVSLDDWSLVLVGPNNKIKSEIAQKDLGKLSNGYLVDQRIVSAYEKLADAAKAAGHPLVMVSAYRSVAYQEEIFNANVNTLMSQGHTKEEAIRITKLTFTEPGYSEHHTGLAVDVVDQNWYQNHTGELLNEGFGDTEGGKWLQAHAREYGFIIRYPKGKHAITQIDYEPWHLRYVGVEVAIYIEEQELTFEEFLEEAKEHIARKEAELSSHEWEDPLAEDWIYEGSLAKSQESSELTQDELLLNGGNLFSENVFSQTKEVKK